MARTIQQTPVEVFCSYAPADEGWFHQLEAHLSLLQRQGLLTLWHRRMLVPGTAWEHEINQHLETASVILLLISSDFLASDYCTGREIQRALAREHAQEARVIPVLVRPVTWTDAPFAHLQPLPTDAKPIALWSNNDTAFADVAAGIRRVIVEDLPQLVASAPRAAWPPIWNVPYPRNPFFLGRDTALFQIRQHLQAGQTTALSQPQAISGLGGIGKTQLALEYAYRYAQDYQAVLWARAESPEALISSYVAFAALLALPEREAKEQEIIVEAVKRWLQINRHWLLILDNADELAILPGFLPPMLPGHLLITTRAQAAGRLAHRVEIEILSPERGAFFLLRRSGLLAPDAELSQASQEEQTLALQLSQELGGLPLALDQAGAYLEETGTSLAAYWQLYQQYRAELFQERRGGFVVDHPLPVATTWSVSFQRIGERNPGAAELLRLLAWLPPDAIAEELLSAGAAFLGPILAPIAGSAILLDQALEALRAYSLVRRDPRSRMISMHRLVQAVLQDQQNPVERQTWAESVVRAVNAAFPNVEYGTWVQCERYLAHALACVPLIAQRESPLTEASELLYKAGSYLLERTRNEEARLLLESAVALGEQQYGPNHSALIPLLSKQGAILWFRGNYEQAESILRRALTLGEHHLGPMHPQIVTILVGLADVIRDEEHYEQAEPLYQRALSLSEELQGPEHPEVAEVLDCFAVLYWNQGRYEQAEPLYQRALHIQDQHLGPEHTRTAITLYNLATLYRDQGKYEQAEPLYQRALRIREQQSGPNHLGTATALYGLATVYLNQGKYEQAEPLYQRSLRIREQQEPEHARTATTLNSLATLYREQGKYEQAESLYQRALRIREQRLGSEHHDTAMTLGDLAMLYHKQRKYHEARLLYQRALSIGETRPGSEYPGLVSLRRQYHLLLQALRSEDAIEQER